MTTKNNLPRKRGAGKVQVSTTGHKIYQEQTPSLQRYEIRQTHWTLMAVDPRAIMTKCR
jgi:hypothetical protein